MSDPTPYEQRERENGIESFDQYWLVDPKTHEIKRKELTTWKSKLRLVWRKKHTVETLYWWTKWRWDDEDIIVQQYPIKHDDIASTMVPRTYRMINDWTIPTPDLKYLRKGPLLNQDDTEFLVKRQNWFEAIISILSQIQPFVWWLSISLGFYINREEIVELVKKLLDFITSLKN